MSPKAKVSLPEEKTEEGAADTQLAKPKVAAKAKSSASTSKVAKSILEKPTPKATAASVKKKPSFKNMVKKQGKTASAEKAATAMKKSPGNDACRKRPAAAPGPGLVNMAIESLEAEASDLRDKGKALKYQRMKEAGALPNHIVHLIETESKKSSSKRAFATQCINTLFERQSDGALAVRLNHPMFQEAQSIYTKHFQKSSQRAMPKAIMAGLYFNSNESNLQAAIDQGDVIIVQGEDGKDYFAFSEFEISRVDGKTQKQTRAGNVSLKQEQAKELEKAFNSVGWTFKLKHGDRSGLVTQDGDLADSTITLLKQAGDSQDG